MSKYKEWTIEDIKLVFDNISKKMGLGINDIPIKINKRLKKKVAYYEMVLENGIIKPKAFVFSSFILSGLYPEQIVETVIIHEYIHYYTNTKNNKRCKHNKEFEQNCILAGIKSDATIDLSIYEKPIKNYSVVCTKCGYSFQRVRFNKGIEHFKREYKCGKCHGDLEVIKF